MWFQHHTVSVLFSTDGMSFSTQAPMYDGSEQEEWEAIIIKYLNCSWSIILTTKVLYK